MYSQRSNTSWKFYNSLRNEFGYLDFPELKDAEILYSNYGWLLMSQVNNGPLFFFNPLTRQKFQLPPTEKPFDSVCFTSPPLAPIVLFGDEEWKIELYDGFMYANCPPVFHNGLYYCLDGECRSFRVYDPTNDAWTICGHCPQTIEDNEDEDEEEEVTHEFYVVQVDGEIWGVFVMNNDRKVEVLKFDLSKKCWNKVESLGDKCLYVSPNGSFAEVCDGGSDKANKIYFNKFHGKNGVWFSLSSGRYHSVGGDFASKDAYGLTQVDYSTWIKST
ncbi:hypothetical protein ABFX02_12G074300 [Erythranthe guttata]